MSTEPSPSQETPVKATESASTAVHVVGQVETKRGRGNPTGFNGGGKRPIGIKTPLRTKKIYNPDELADGVAIALTQGKGILRAPSLKAVSPDDRSHLARILQEPVEAFNDRLASKLRLIADKVADRIDQKVDEDAFKTGELGFIFSVMHDKRLSLDGSRALQNASINLTVNQFGPTPKSQLLGELDGLGSVKVVSPAQAVG